ncbi:MAG: YceI family protein [Pseudomonadota bacterium]
MKIIAFLSALIFLSQMAWAAPAPYVLLKDESRVGFTWFLRNEPFRGRMPVKSADVVLDFERLNQSRVNVSVDVSKAQAGFVFATQAMKGQSMLWAERFPEIVFESTNVRRNGTGALIDGNLTVRGVTRPVVFEAELFRPAGVAQDDFSRLTIRLNGSLSRKAFGADGWSDWAGDEVRLAIVARVQVAQ